MPIQALAELPVWKNRLSSISDKNTSAHADLEKEPAPNSDVKYTEPYVPVRANSF